MFISIQQLSAALPLAERVTNGGKEKKTTTLVPKICGSAINLNRLESLVLIWKKQTCTRSIKQV